MLIVGAAVGSAVTMLVTPHEGRYFRKKISNKSNDFTESLKMKFSSILKEAKDEYEAKMAKADKHGESIEENSKDFAGKVNG